MVGTESSAIAAMVAMGCFMRSIWHRKTPGLLPVGSNNFLPSKSPSDVGERNFSIDDWTSVCYLSIMSTELSIDPNFDKQAVFQLLARFDLSAGDLADVFASYLTIRPAKDVDLASLRGALKKRGTATQIEVLKAAGRLLTSEEMGERLGLASRQSIHNLKLKGKLLAISFDNRRGDYFPEFQLDGAGVRDWIPEILKRIPDGWSALAFLTARRKELGGIPFLMHVLQAPSKASEVIAAAEAYAS
jgi:hypothetical protein